MAIIRVHPHLIDSNNTSNGSVLLYSAANGVVEFGTISTGGPDNNAWVNANDYSTLQSAYANDYSTLLTTAANDWNTLQTARANDYSTYNALDTNVFNTYNTLTANIYNTFAYLDSNTGPAGSNQQVQFNNNGLFGASSSLIFDGATLKAPMLEATQSSGDEGGEVKLNKPATNTTITNGITIDVYQDKVRLFETGGTNRGGYWDITSLSAGVGTNLLSGGGGGDVANAWVNANDYNTLTSAYSNDGATLLSARANDYSTLLTTAANDWNTLLSARANDYTTLLTTAANDYATFTTLTANIYNTYTALSGGGSNTSVYVGNTLVSNTALIFEAGNGVSFTANATSKVITFTTSMSNVTSEIIEIDGTANTFTLAKAAYNTHMVIVSYNGLLQDPRRYVLTNNAGGSYITINNTSPLIADSNLEVRYFDFFDLPGISSGGGGGGTQAQGTVSGYTSGGYTPTLNTIDKFSFAVDGNASDVGDLSQARRVAAGQSSSVSGYTSGGGSPAVNTIDKFPFASNANATDVGDLTAVIANLAGQSSDISGYSSGGVLTNVIDKFPFAANANATDVGDLTQSRYNLAGQSSTSSGYSSGGFAPPTNTNTIDKFPFASNGNASDVGDLTVARNQSAGQSSSSSGYTSGGSAPTGIANIIDKFPFSADANSTDVGDLTQARHGVAGQSSTSSGYSSGGNNGYVNTIDKFPFSSDANASDVGDLTQGRYAAAGQQV